VYDLNLYLYLIIKEEAFPWFRPCVPSSWFVSSVHRLARKKPFPRTESYPDTNQNCLASPPWHGPVHDRLKIYVRTNRTYQIRSPDQIARMVLIYTPPSALQHRNSNSKILRSWWTSRRASPYGNPTAIKKDVHFPNSAHRCRSMSTVPAPCSFRPRTTVCSRQSQSRPSTVNP
jgi:hypothetical protein